MKHPQKQHKKGSRSGLQTARRAHLKLINSDSLEDDLRAMVSDRFCRCGYAEREFAQKLAEEFPNLRRLLKKDNWTAVAAWLKGASL